MSAFFRMDVLWNPDDAIEDLIVLLREKVFVHADYVLQTSPWLLRKYRKRKSKKLEIFNL